MPEGEEPPKHRVVAVKRLKANILESEDDVFSFITEARLLVRLQHPSIVEYIGLGCEDASSPEAQWRTMYLVQEVGHMRVALQSNRGCGGAGRCLVPARTRGSIGGERLAAGAGGGCLAGW